MSISFKMRFQLVTPVALCLALFVGQGFSNPTRSNTEQVQGFKSLFRYPSSVKANEPLEWWQETMFYQIYPRSFKDSDGDGTGDIKGIISKADYLESLGVNAVWISPIYKSPMKDFGYDISNFTDIEPVFGTLDDFKEMSEVFKSKNIKVIMDFVPNHSSDQHPWFIKSVEREGKYADYYVWKDAKGVNATGHPIPPNNWTSVFGGSMWQWNEKRQQFYLHQFVAEQPDLNFENRDVWIEILSAVKFWLDHGVDGFRVDAVPHLFEDQGFKDEPPNENSGAREDEYHYYKHIYTNNLPRNLDLLAQMRQLLDVYTGEDEVVRCMMVEAAVPGETMGSFYGNQSRPIAHFPFNFNLLGFRPEHNAAVLSGLVNEFFKYMPKGKWANMLIGNHDNRRMPTRFTPRGIDGANMINILIQASSVSYNGEEIGMEDQWISWEDTVDPAGCQAGIDRYNDTSRDPERTPFQWDTTKNAGFSSAEKTWLPMHEDHLTNNVQLQEDAEESHLKVYKRLIELRKRNVWKYGDYESFVSNDEKVFGFTRTVSKDVDDTSFLVLVNVSEESVTVDASSVNKVPAQADIYVRSVGFEDGASTIGSTISTNAVKLGARNSVVLTFANV